MSRPDVYAPEFDDSSEREGFRWSGEQVRIEELLPGTGTGLRDPGVPR